MHGVSWLKWRLKVGVLIFISPWLILSAWFASGKQGITMKMKQGEKRNEKIFILCKQSPGSYLFPSPLY